MYNGMEALTTGEVAAAGSYRGNGLCPSWSRALATAAINTFFCNKKEDDSVIGV